MVFAKSSSQSSKKKMMQRQRKESSKNKANVQSSTGPHWSRDKNVSILATSHLLSEVHGVIEEDQEEELRTSSRANFESARRADTLNSSVQLVEVGSSADMSGYAPQRAR